MHLTACTVCSWQRLLLHAAQRTVPRAPLQFKPRAGPRSGCLEAAPGRLPMAATLPAGQQIGLIPKHLSAHLLCNLGELLAAVHAPEEVACSRNRGPLLICTCKRTQAPCFSKERAGAPTAVVLLTPLPKPCAPRPKELEAVPAISSSHVLPANALCSPHASPLMLPPRPPSSTSYDFLCGCCCPPSAGRCGCPGCGASSTVTRFSRSPSTSWHCIGRGGRGGRVGQPA